MVVLPYVVRALGEYLNDCRASGELSSVLPYMMDSQSWSAVRSQSMAVLISHKIRSPPGRIHMTRQRKLGGKSKVQEKEEKV